MDADIEGVLNVRMALAAGRGHAEFINRRLRIIGGKNGVSTVAIRADRSLHRSVSDSLSVNALLVRDERLSANAIRLHQEFLSMASTACRGDARVVQGRIRMAASQHFVSASVAVLAIGCDSARRGQLCVRAVSVRFPGIRMTTRA